MHRLVAVIAVAMFLAACGKSAPPPDVASAAPPASAPEAAAPPASAPATTAVDEPAAPPAADTDNEARVDQTIDNVLGDHAAYRAVIDAFQRAVAAKDAQAVSKLVDYPFTASIDGQRTKIADAEAFVAQYDRIVTPAIARAIGEQRYGRPVRQREGRDVRTRRGLDQWRLQGRCLQARRRAGRRDSADRTLNISASTNPLPQMESPQ